MSGDARVALSAACTAARQGRDAWVTWRGERLRLAPVPVEPRDCIGREVVYVRSGRFRVARMGARKDALPLLDEEYRVQPKQLRAVVVERYPRER